VKRLAVAAAVLTGYAGFSVALSAAGVGARAAPRDDERGKVLYAQGCATCHGVGGVGTDRGPSRVGVGAASADFYLTTGRMPLSRPGTQAVRKPPAYGPDDIRALVDYVASLGPGQARPDVSQGDIRRGGVLFQANCAACHGYAGSGGALSYGEEAAPLTSATATQVAEAVRIGPGTMPAFNAGALSDEQVNDLVTYVGYLHAPDDRGGAALGHRGPLPEGFVAWFGGLVAILFCCLWIGVRR
jgi:ubiquinol-cytochrome c reductase cytochrome c subunit